jgi:hypothetical protein
MSKNSINCPQCQTQIDISEILIKDIESRYKEKYKDQLKELESQKQSLETQIQKQVHSKLLIEKAKQKEEITRAIQKEHSEQIQFMQEDLQRQSSQLKTFHKQQAELQKLKREKDQLEDKIKAESEIQLNETMNRERERLKKTLDSKHQFKIQELEKQLSDQKKLTEEMQRKQHQGSMQLQGEIQELAIEEWLMKSFPLDDIEEIKKGALGGDCLQIINTTRNKNCGVIYYESKRTKSFQPQWIEKFKKDMQQKSADIGILVTQSMPKGWKRMGQEKGVWICDFEEFKSLSQVLRQAQIQVFQTRQSEENKGDKMVMLYDYMTSNSFKMQIQSIVEGFSQLKDDLEKEKRAMQRLWKTRETQLEKVLVNTIDMYGSVKGLAGPSMGVIEALDFPEDD